MHKTVNMDNVVCAKCTKECKQSDKVVVVSCKMYQKLDKTSNELGNLKKG